MAIKNKFLEYNNLEIKLASPIGNTQKTNIKETNSKNNLSRKESFHFFLRNETGVPNKIIIKIEQKTKSLENFIISIINPLPKSLNIINRKFE